MCGRLNISDDPFSQWVCELLDIPFTAKSNSDLRPTHEVATVAAQGSHLLQVNATWGIKPNWAKKLLINAQAETVAEKPTFRNAFGTKRCVIPCSGYYEWQSLAAGGKQKWLFEQDNQSPLFMAGILFPGDMPQLVTLTTQPKDRFKVYHHRFPQFVHPDDINSYLLADQSTALKILLHNPDERIHGVTSQ